MKIAVEGCCHGELDKIYDSVRELEKQNGFKIDLLIICGDFQAVRNFDDLQAMAVPPKFQKLNTFYKYYSKQKLAPVLTVFIGGNHEASNYMQELPYGGWVAPNIYYMGYAGVIQIGSVRIGGISGIFKGHDYNRGHFERPPYDNSTKRSVYHVRNLEIFRLKQITRHVDIFISHDWPKHIYHYGNTEALIKMKPFLRQEIEDNKLGSGPLYDILCHLQPTYWFAAHLHVKFAAHIQHQPKQGQVKSTKFLSLDKCLPGRNFLQVFEVPHDEKEGLNIKLDPEWLTILQTTDHLLNLTSSNKYMPGPGCGERYEFSVEDTDMKETMLTFGGDMTLPRNFVHTSSPLEGNPGVAFRQRRQELSIQINPQTTLLCSMLGITDPNAKFLGKTCQQLLDESVAGAAGGSDSGADVAYESDSNEDMPSTIDSSMNVSNSRLSTSLSSRWDTYKTTSEILDNSCQQKSRQMLATSTSAKNDSCDTPFCDDLDDDAEFLAIVSAQKNKSLNASSQIPSVLPSIGGLNSSTCAHDGSVSHRGVHSDKHNVSSERYITNTVNDCGDNELSSSHISNSQDKTSLKPERTSFGMSGLCLDAAEVAYLVTEGSVSLGKNDSAENSNVSRSVITPESVNKLKRRNVSVYSECGTSPLCKVRRDSLSVLNLSTNPTSCGSDGDLVKS